MHIYNKIIHSHFSSFLNLSPCTDFILKKIFVALFRASFRLFLFAFSFDFFLFLCHFLFLLRLSQPNSLISISVVYVPFRSELLLFSPFLHLITRHVLFHLSPSLCFCVLISIRIFLPMFFLFLFLQTVFLYQDFLPLSKAFDLIPSYLLLVFASLDNDVKN